MQTRPLSLAALSLAAVLSVSAWAQGTVPGAGGNPVGPNGVSPSEAATEKTPGTPGAADTPGEFQAPNTSKNLPPASSDRAVAKLKKQADKASRKNARAADKHSAVAPANSSATPPK